MQIINGKTLHSDQLFERLFIYGTCSLTMYAMWLCSGKH